MKREEFEQLKSSCIGHTLIKAGRVYNDYAFNSFKETIGDDDLKPSHLNLFSYIPFTGISVVELAKKVGVSKQAISVLVNELIDKDVLMKKEHPTDKRSSLICFNEESSEGIYQGMNILKELDQDLVKIMGKANTKIVLNSLLKVIQKFEIV